MSFDDKMMSKAKATILLATIVILVITLVVREPPHQADKAAFRDSVRSIMVLVHAKDADDGTPLQVQVTSTNSGENIERIDHASSELGLQID